MRVSAPIYTALFSTSISSPILSRNNFNYGQVLIFPTSQSHRCSLTTTGFAGEILHESFHLKIFPFTRMFQGVICNHLQLTINGQGASQNKNKWSQAIYIYSNSEEFIREKFKKVWSFPDLWDPGGLKCNPHQPLQATIPNGGAMLVCWW